MAQRVLLGDEAVAMGAVDAGITAAYAYPGTPATEIMEFLIQHSAKHGAPRAGWCANEKTAYEGALGVSFVGKRALVSMKHVGLNVAADPFMNSAIVSINGGLVLAVADDPGMHSSQNEQDSRYFADFAHVICLEPANQQEAYDMTREAFDLSERFGIPVLLRVVTRLCHSRAVVDLREKRPENPLKKAPDPSSWILLPSNARRQWHTLLGQRKEIHAYMETTPFNKLTMHEGAKVGVITTGIARNYFMESRENLPDEVSHLHIGAYPYPEGLIRRLAESVETVLVIEEGYPFVERFLRGIIPPPVGIRGKLSGDLPVDGEMTPDLVRGVLGLKPHESVTPPAFDLPGRPPQLCPGCPHADTYDAIKGAFGSEAHLVTSDIGCYTLGALPPYNAIESCVCMGASVGMAKGASEAGMTPVLAVIGDSTFLHSGVTPLMDCVRSNTDMTLVILDNETVGMTGGQPTILSSSRLEPIIAGLGVDPDHIKIITAHRKHTEENIEVFRREAHYKGLSVIIAVRECVETAKRKKK